MDYNGHAGSLKMKDKELDNDGTKTPLTKLVFDILDAPDYTAAIELAFFGKPYTYMKGLETATNVDSYDRKDLLFFNEMGEDKEIETLEAYENAYKSAICGTHGSDGGGNFDQD